MKRAAVFLLIVALFTGAAEARSHSYRSGYHAPRTSHIRSARIRHRAGIHRVKKVKIFSCC